MSFLRTMILIPVLLALAGSGVPAAAPVDLSGTWVGVWDTEDDVGADTLTLELQKSGATYTGTISDTLKYIPAKTSISQVEVNGNGIAFCFVMIFVENRPDDIQIRAVWDGHTLKGALQFLAKGAEVPFEMKRK